MRHRSPMNDGDWSEYKPGVSIKRLGGTADAGFYLVRMDPGAVLPKDSRPEEETLQVVEGAAIFSYWPRWDASGRKHSDELDPSHRVAVIVEPRLAHELRAHPVEGALLFTAARPDWRVA